MLLFSRSLPYQWTCILCCMLTLLSSSHSLCLKLQWTQRSQILLNTFHLQDPQLQQDFPSTHLLFPQQDHCQVLALLLHLVSYWFLYPPRRLVSVQPLISFHLILPFACLLVPHLTYLHHPIVCHLVISLFLHLSSLKSPSRFLLSVKLGTPWKTRRRFKLLHLGMFSVYWQYL